MKSFPILLLAVFLLVAPTGCKPSVPGNPSLSQDANAFIAKNKASIIDVVKLAAEVGTERGLKEWAKKNPDGAKEAAAALAKNIDDALLPYFKDDQKLLTAEEVQQLLDASLFDKVPDVVKVAVIAASAVLDYYLPIPDSGTYLTKDQKDIVAAFLEGVRNGCEDFSTPSVRSTRKVNKDTMKEVNRLLGRRWVGAGKAK